MLFLDGFLQLLLNQMILYNSHTTVVLKIVWKKIRSVTLSGRFQGLKRGKDWLQND